MPRSFDVDRLSELLGAFSSEDLEILLDRAELPRGGGKARKATRLGEALLDGEVRLPDLLAALTKPRLVAVMRGLGLDATGTKAELQARVSRWVAARRRARKERAEVPPAGAWSIPDWGQAFFFGQQPGWSRGFGADAAPKRTKPRPPPPRPEPRAPSAPREPTYPARATENERFFLYRAKLSWPVDAETLRRAWKLLVLEMHPDRNPGREAASFELIAINKGYDALRERL